MTAAQAAAIQARLSSLSSTDHSRPVLTVAVARFLARSHGLKLDTEAHWAICEEADRLISMICAHIMGATQGQFARDGKQTWQLDDRLNDAFGEYLGQFYRCQGDHSEIEPDEQQPVTEDGREYHVDGSLVVNFSNGGFLDMPPSVSADERERLIKDYLANPPPPAELEPQDAEPVKAGASHGA